MPGNFCLTPVRSGWLYSDQIDFSGEAIGNKPTPGINPPGIDQRCLQPRQGPGINAQRIILFTSIGLLLGFTRSKQIQI